MKNRARHRLRSPEVRELLDRLPLQTDPEDFTELLAMAARVTVAADRADCRLAPPADDPLADPERRLTARLVDPGGEVLGSLVAVRAEGAEPFDADDAAAFEALAHHGGALLTVLPVRSHPAPSAAPARGPAPSARSAPVRASAPAGGRAAAVERSAAPDPDELARLTRGPADVFRREALETLHGASGEHGKPLELTAGWLRWAFRILVVGLIAGAVFLATAEATDRVRGPAELRAVGAGGPDRAVVRVPAAAGVRPGMAGSLRLDAVPETELPVVVRSVGAASGGEGELPVEVELTAPLPERSLGIALADGMPGRAEIVVRREPLLHSLMPGLRSLRESGTEEAPDG